MDCFVTDLPLYGFKRTKCFNKEYLKTDIPTEMLEYLTLKCNLKSGTTSQKTKKKFIINHSDDCWFKHKKIKLYHCVCEDKKNHEDRCIVPLKDFSYSSCTPNCSKEEEQYIEFTDYDKAEFDPTNIMFLIKKWNIRIKFSEFMEFIKPVNKNETVKMFNTEWKNIFSAASTELGSLLKLIIPEVSCVENIKTINKVEKTKYTTKVTIKNKTYEMNVNDTIAIWYNCARICQGVPAIDYSCSDVKVDNLNKQLLEYSNKLQCLLLKMKKPVVFNMIKKNVLEDVKVHLENINNTLTYRFRLNQLLDKLQNMNDIVKVEQELVNFINNENKSLRKKAKKETRDSLKNVFNRSINTCTNKYNKNILNRCILLNSYAKYMIARFCKLNRCHMMKFIKKYKFNKLVAKKLEEKKKQQTGWFRENNTIVEEQMEPQTGWSRGTKEVVDKPQTGWTQRTDTVDDEYKKPQTGWSRGTREIVDKPQTGWTRRTDTVHDKYKKPQTEWSRGTKEVVDKPQTGWSRRTNTFVEKHTNENSTYVWERGNMVENVKNNNIWSSKKKTVISEVKVVSEWQRGGTRKNKRTGMNSRTWR